MPGNPKGSSPKARRSLNLSHGHKFRYTHFLSAHSAVPVPWRFVCAKCKVRNLDICWNHGIITKRYSVFKAHYVPIIFCVWLASVHDYVINWFMMHLRTQNYNLVSIYSFHFMLFISVYMISFNPPMPEQKSARYLQTTLSNTPV